MKVEIQVVNRPNKNNRIYPTKVLEKAIKDYTNEFIKEDRAFVCKTEPKSHSVDLTDVIGKVTYMDIENCMVVAEIEKLDANNSDDFWPLIEQGIMFVRQSGMGSLIQQIDGTFLVNNDYQLISLFLTPNPA